MVNLDKYLAKFLDKSWQIFGEKLFMSTFICWDIGWETYYASLIVIYDPLIFLHRKEIAWDTKSNFRNHEASLSSLTFDKRRKPFSRYIMFDQRKSLLFRFSLNASVWISIYFCVECTWCVFESIHTHMNWLMILLLLVTHCYSLMGMFLLS